MIFNLKVTKIVSHQDKKIKERHLSNGMVITTENVRNKSSSTTKHIVYQDFDKPTKKAIFQAWNWELSYWDILNKIKLGKIK